MATNTTDSAFNPQELRRRAIERLQGRHGKVVDMPAADVTTLVHELEVYQVELEVQNEELRRAQLELAAALERYRDLYDRAPVGYLTLDADGIVLQANQAAAQLCFRDREELEGQRLEKIAFHKDRDKLWLLLQRAVVTRQPQACEFRIERPSGAPRWVRADISCLNPYQESPNGFRITLADITACVQAEENLRESEERFRTLADNIFQLVWMADTNGGRSWYNQRWLDYTGMTLEEAQGWGWTKVHHPDHVDRVVKGIRQAWDTGEPWEDTYPLRSKTGEYRWFLSRAVPIQDAEGKIVHWFGTNTDITERERLLAEEQRLRGVAEAHDRAKDEFLSVISHELRTPLNAIFGYAQIICENPADVDANARASEIILRNARAQQQLIDDLLDMGRVISGKLSLEVAQADFRLLLEETVVSLRPAAEDKRIELTAQLDEAPQRLICDVARTRQVVWNLLQNAIKFTPEGGSVELSVERAGESLRLIVRDTGEGIEPDFLPAIFDRFTQGDATRTRRQGGLGLGLALVKQVVEMHGGSIEAASEGVGQGATFTVTLPLNMPRDVSRPSPRPAVGKKRAEPEVKRLESLPRLDGVRALVVEDEEDAREMIAVTLGRLGASVKVAASGREALEQLEGSAFDALICDIAMPDMDGYELIRRLRALEKDRGQRIPAIALTALARHEDRLQALKAGFQMHVAKPVELAELVVILARLLQLPQQERS